MNRGTAFLTRGLRKEVSPEASQTPAQGTTAAEENKTGSYLDSDNEEDTAGGG